MSGDAAAQKGLHTTLCIPAFFFISVICVFALLMTRSRSVCPGYRYRSQVEYLQVENFDTVKIRATAPTEFDTHQLTFSVLTLGGGRNGYRHLCSVVQISVRVRKKGSVFARGENIEVTLPLPCSGSDYQLRIEPESSRPYNPRSSSYCQSYMMCPHTCPYFITGSFIQMGGNKTICAKSSPNNLCHRKVLPEITYPLPVTSNTPTTASSGKISTTPKNEDDENNTVIEKTRGFKLIWIMVPLGTVFAVVIALFVAYIVMVRRKFQTLNGTRDKLEAVREFYQEKVPTFEDDWEADVEVSEITAHMSNIPERIVELEMNEGLHFIHIDC